MEELKFDWKYAVNKLLIFLTSTKNVAIIAGALVAIFGLEVPAEWQGVIAMFAGALMAALKAYEDVKK